MNKAMQHITELLPGIVATAAERIGIKLSDATVQRIVEVIREIVVAQLADLEFRAAVKTEAHAEIRRQMQRFALATGAYRNGSQFL